jgi:hypothetical protein
MNLSQIQLNKNALLDKITKMETTEIYKASEVVHWLRESNFQITDKKPFKTLDPQFLLTS